MKDNNFKFVALAVAALTAINAPVLTAQETSSTGAFVLEEIIVTARKREESLQDSAIAVTAIQGDLLQEMGVSDITGIANVVPNVSFSTTGTVSGSTSSAVVYIRGVGQNDYVPVVDPGVGIYVDDIYMGRTVGSVLDLMDVKSIEVIRGPQGTLFGRNSVGGAISLTTNDPSGSNDGKIRAVVGDQGRAEIFATYNAVLSDKVSGVFNVMSRDRDGTVKRVNVPGSENLGNENSLGARFKFNVDASDKLRFQFAGDYVYEREESAPEVNIFYNDNFTLPGAWNGLNGFAAFAPTSTASGCVAGNSNVGVNCYNNSQQLGPFASGETSLSQNDIDSWGLSLVTEYDFSDTLSGKLIVAHRDLDAAFSRQVDGTALGVFENRDIYLSDQTSLDLRLNGSGDRFNWVLGAFYFEEGSDNQLDFTGSLEGTLYPIHYGGTTDNSNYAFYGDGIWDVTERLHVSFGMRYTDEEKSATPNAFAYPGCADLIGQILSPSAACDSVVSPAAIPRRAVGTTGYLIDPVKNKISFDEVTYRGVVAYDISDTTSIYGSISTGFKAGGFEWRVTNTSFATDPQFASAEICGAGNECLPTFDPESVTTYELGLKSDITDTLRLNAAVFTSSYDDLIIASNPPGSIATFQTNAGNASIDGLELELTWIATPNTLVNFSAGLLDAGYDSLNEGTSVSLDDEFVFTPDTTLSLGVSHVFALNSGGSVTARLDGVHKSDQEFEAANTEFTRDDGFTSLNAALKYTPVSEKWSAALGVQNLSDELYIVGGDANSAIGYENVIFARPRNFYLAIDYAF